VSLIQSISDYVLTSLTAALGLFLTLFLPIIVCLFILRILSTLQEWRLWDIGGYKGVLVVAWIGAPVHELAHLVGAVLFLHKIKEVKLFKPDPKTGTLGYVSHSYKPRSIYQAFIGNSVIALAPFFGGSALLYLLVKIMVPDFSLYGQHVPPIDHLTYGNMFYMQSYYGYFKSTWSFFAYLGDRIFSNDLLRGWKFYVAIYLIFCISCYLSPSREDFRLFWKPFSLFFGVVVLVIMATRPFGNVAFWLISNCSEAILKIAPVLYLAIFLNVMGCLLIHGIWIFKRIFFTGR
jgi:hypothetical protein